jgi:hypothetical protein
VQDQIEKWVCGNTECARANEKDVKECESCGWVLPRAFKVWEDGVRRDSEVLMRKWGDGQDAVDKMFEVERPTGDAPGGGKWIPRSETEQKREVR